MLFKAWYPESKNICRAASEPGLRRWRAGDTINNMFLSFTNPFLRHLITPIFFFGNWATLDPAFAADSSTVLRSHLETPVYDLGAVCISKTFVSLPGGGKRPKREPRLSLKQAPSSAWVVSAKTSLTAAVPASDLTPILYSTERMHRVLTLATLQVTSWLGFLTAEQPSGFLYSRGSFLGFSFKLSQRSL